MTDKINEKVINIFAKHSEKKPPATEEEEIYTSPDGFNYIHIKYDENGHLLDQDKLLEKADEMWYIVKILEHHKDSPTIKNYKVPGIRLLEFLSNYISDQRPGKIIEIDKYYPDGLA